MRRLLHTLRRLGSSAGAARRGRRAAPTARPGLEALEGRDMPATLTTSPPLLTANQPVAYYQPPTLSATWLAGKTVALAEPGNPSNAYGWLNITSVTRQADSSYRFTAGYLTALYDVHFGLRQPAVLSVTGTLGAPQVAGLGISTCEIHFEVRQQVVIGGYSLYPLTADEHVKYDGTVTLTRTQATVYGQLFDCLEHEYNHNPINPFGCSTVPASGTFV